MAAGSVHLSCKQLYSRSLCPAFPPVECAFAYGSAVFQQQGRAMVVLERTLLPDFTDSIRFLLQCIIFVSHMSHIQGKMLDLVFVVCDPEQWHEENLKRNRAHYSFMKWPG